ncbi:uncharacterized protein LOC128546762 [Mercenaria mercenaria]|uniref:uncharacterized protein LOC128546762 n=1 Tax=Mercenaria mercenaria TaxID=6596 RepID=UPI00234E7D46|nr:uncharacterized protein LOC128546762 [Mercenaria mercenaria]
MEKGTKELQHSYIQMHTSIHRNIELCKRIRKNYMPKEERLREQQLQDLTESAQEELLEENQIMHGNLRKLKRNTSIILDTEEGELSADVDDLTTDIDNLAGRDEEERVKQDTKYNVISVKHSAVGEGSFGEDSRRIIQHEVINESILVSTLQPRTAMTGGIRETAIGKRSHPNVFHTFRYESMECLKKLFYDSDNPNVSFRATRVKDRMYRRNTGALVRLKTVVLTVNKADHMYYNRYLKYLPYAIVYLPSDY